MDCTCPNCGTRFEAFAVEDEPSHTEKYIRDKCAGTIRHIRESTSSDDTLCNAALLSSQITPWLYAADNRAYQAMTAAEIAEACVNIAKEF